MEQAVGRFPRLFLAPEVRRLKRYERGVGQFVGTKLKDSPRHCDFVMSARR